MKRYAAVKVPQKASPPPGSRMLRTGGAGGRPLGIRPLQGPSLSVFSLQAGSLMGSTGRALNVSP
mgnify:CR=1 FL=1